MLRSAYRDYLDLSRRFSDMQRSYERAWSKANSLTERVEELWNENGALRERLRDLGRVEWALGRDTVETIFRRRKAWKRYRECRNRGRKGR